MNRQRSKEKRIIIDNVSPDLEYQSELSNGMMTNSLSQFSHSYNHDDEIA